MAWSRWYTAIIVTVVLLTWDFCWYLYKKKKRSKSFKGYVVLITGSANGLGKRLSLVFSREKCHVICADVDPVGNEDTIRKIKTQPSDYISPEPDDPINILQATNLEDVQPSVVHETHRCNYAEDLKAVAYTCDVSDRKQVNVLAEKVLSEFGHVDILVNNAGVAYPESLLKLTDQHVENLFGSNLLAHFWTTRAFLPKMIERKQGCIVAIASIVAKSGLGFLAPYSSSKYGVKGFMDSLQQEMRISKTGVKTLTVFPSYMNTGLMPGDYQDPGCYRINKWMFFHVVTVKRVARHIIYAIKEGQSSLFVPHYYRKLYFIIGILPQFLYNIVIDLFRINGILNRLEDSP